MDPNLVSTSTVQRAAALWRALSARGPTGWRRELRLVTTPAGAALLFDAAVFLLLLLPGLSLLPAWRSPFGSETGLMLCGALLLGWLWASICTPDWRRYLKLRRRLLAQAPRAPAPLRRVTTLRLRPAVPLRVRSAYRPAQPGGALRSQWAWRAGPR